MRPMTDKQPPSRADVDFGYRRVDAREKRDLVRGVFDSVAGRYDLMNDLMSLGVHRAWKRAFLQALDPSPRRILLDLASGTGDIGFGWLERGGGPAILTDVNASMLAVAARRGESRALPIAAKAARLPVAAKAARLPVAAKAARRCRSRRKPRAVRARRAIACG